MPTPTMKELTKVIYICLQLYGFVVFSMTNACACCEVVDLGNATAVTCMLCDPLKCY